MFEKGRNERNKEPKSNQKANRVDHFATFYHKSFMCVFEHVGDIEGDANCEPIRNLHCIFITE